MQAQANMIKSKTMTTKVILNPYSNRWNAEKRWPQAEELLKQAGVKFDVVVSQKQHEVIELARQAALDGFSPIIAAGGDGTFGEVVRGMAMAAKNEKESLGPMGILPFGTANDLVNNLGLPLDLEGAVKVIAAGKTRRMDICRVNDVYFINNSAIGLEPYITTIEKRIGWIKGMARYLVAAVRGIMDKPSWQADITWDDGEYHGPVLLVTVGNAPRTGGVFYMTPHADPFDGKLTFVHGYRKTRLSIFGLLPKTMKPGAGSYVEMPGIVEKNATWVKIKFDHPSPAHADGEIFSTGITELEYRVYPGRLQMLLQ
jgi:diacylglycerol kinase (ATP)